MSIDLKNLTSLLRALSWMKIAQLATLTSIIVLFWMMWVFRMDMYSSLRMGSLNNAALVTSIDVSDQTKTYINDVITRSSTLIGGIQVINVDFKRNIRSSSYFAISDPILKDAYQEYMLTKVANTPLFNDSEINNRRVIDLVNGEFICSDFTSTLAAKIYARASNSIVMICSISIPPLYGKFSGYLNIYVKRQPDNNDRDVIRQTAREISERIYVNDISHDATSAAKTSATRIN